MRDTLTATKEVMASVSGRLEKLAVLFEKAREGLESPKWESHVARFDGAVAGIVRCARRGTSAGIDLRKPLRERLSDPAFRSAIAAEGAFPARLAARKALDLSRCEDREE